MAKKLTIDFLSIKTKNSRLESIRTLNLWGNDLEDISLLADLPNLELLALSVNKIRTLEALKSLTKLKELYLRKNNIADFNELDYISNLPHLKILTLNENPISEISNYREIVLEKLPRLTKFDEVIVTEIKAQLQLNIKEKPKEKPKAKDIDKMSKKNKSPQVIKEDTSFKNSSFDQHNPLDEENPFEQNVVKNNQVKIIEESMNKPKQNSRNNFIKQKEYKTAIPSAKKVKKIFEFGNCFLNDDDDNTNHYNNDDGNDIYNTSNNEKNDEDDITPPLSVKSQRPTKKIERYLEFDEDNNNISSSKTPPSYMSHRKENIIKPKKKLIIERPIKEDDDFDNEFISDNEKADVIKTEPNIHQPQYKKKIIGNFSVDSFNKLTQSQMQPMRMKEANDLDSFPINNLNCLQKSTQILSTHTPNQENIDINQIVDINSFPIISPDKSPQKNNQISIITKEDNNTAGIEQSQIVVKSIKLLLTTLSNNDLKDIQAEINILLLNQ